MYPISKPLFRPGAQARASDEELLFRYRDGDVAAFDALVHRYERPLFNYLLRCLRNAPLAEEVFQVTFLRLHEKANTFQSDGRLRPWLYSIATHAAIDALRREGRHQATSLDEPHADENGEASQLLDLLQSATLSPWEQAEEHERAQWARQAVNALPEHLRIVLLLIYFQGLKYREVAEVLQLPLGTVKSRVHQALLALNLAWRQEHGNEAP